MSKSRSFGGVNTAIWACIKSSSLKEHGTVYEPADGTEGTATTDTFVGKVVLGFVYDALKDTVTYNIVKKPMIVGDAQIWNGIQETINHCAS